jgi:hypothetical protein
MQFNAEARRSPPKKPCEENGKRKRNKKDARHHKPSPPGARIDRPPDENAADTAPARARVARAILANIFLFLSFRRDGGEGGRGRPRREKEDGGRRMRAGRCRWHGLVMCGIGWPALVGGFGYYRACSFIYFWFLEAFGIAPVRFISSS